MQYEDTKDVSKELQRRVGKKEIIELRKEIRSLYEKSGGTCSVFAGAVS